MVLKIRCEDCGAHICNVVMVQNLNIWIVGKVKNEPVDDTRIIMLCDKCREKREAEAKKK